MKCSDSSVGDAANKSKPHCVAVMHQTGEQVEARQTHLLGVGAEADGRGGNVMDADSLLIRKVSVSAHLEKH